MITKHKHFLAKNILPKSYQFAKTFYRQQILALSSS